MSNWFEDLTKTLANETLPRRQAIRRISGTVAGFVLASWLPGQAFASSNQNHHCGPPVGSCMGTFPSCGINKYNNCYCFQKMGTPFGGVCGCNSYCSSLPFCTANAQCPKGYGCVTNTGCACTGGICILKCTRTCQFPSNGAGRTAVATV